MTRIREALAALLAEVDRATCRHEVTYRIRQWTLCRECSTAWADDRGGFVPYADSPAVAMARAALAAALQPREMPPQRYTAAESAGSGGSSVMGGGENGATPGKGFVPYALAAPEPTPEMLEAGAAVLCEAEYSTMTCEPDATDAALRALRERLDLSHPTAEMRPVWRRAMQAAIGEFIRTVESGRE